MKKIFSLLLFIAIALSGIKDISAIPLRKEYSDNVERYIVKAGTKSNLINQTINAKLKQKINLDYKKGPKNMAATFASSNKKVATVHKTSGVVKIKKAGKATIYIKGSDGRRFKVHFNTTSMYVLVSIKKQNARLYINGKLKKKVPVVTGKPGATATPKGTFKLAYKQRNTYLDGATVGYDYYLPVKYWMPLANTGGVGFHDASWRPYSKFGKKYYLWDGSHGCINMRTKDVAYFYKMMKPGTKVKIY